MTEQQWNNYSEQKPETAGVYRWRLPINGIDGAFVTYVAQARKRNAGFEQVVAAPFAHWDGYRLNVPPATQWQPCEGAFVEEHKFDDIRVEGVEHDDCPFCGRKPRWDGMNWNQGVLVGAAPHQYNHWKLVCCAWTGNPESTNPLYLAEKRNSLLAGYRLKALGIAPGTIMDWEQIRQQIGEAFAKAGRIDRG